MKKIFLAFISLITLSSCLKDDSPIDYTIENEQEIQAYLTKNNLQATKDEYGVYYIVEDEGTGTQPKNSDVVKINYQARLLNGNIYNESGDKPSYLKLDKLIKGLSLGIPHFKTGGAGKIIIPSNLGYGSVSYNNIPAGSVLIFDIELVNTFDDIDEANDDEILDYFSENDITGPGYYTKTDSGLYFFIEEQGSGENPTVLDNVTVAYKGYFTDGTVFDESDSNGVSFYLENVIKGWKEGITYFKTGSSGKLFIPSSLGYGPNNYRDIPGGSVLIFDINLISINN